VSIKEIIGLSITEIRYNYTYQNEYDMQEFFAYLKLSNELIIEIPQYFDLEISEDSELNKKFKNAKKPIESCKSRIENQKITDIHFCFYEQKPDLELKAYIELENGICFSECNYGPMGITTVDLEILSNTDFEKLKTELEEGFEIKSYLSELKNVCQQQGFRWVCNTNNETRVERNLFFFITLWVYRKGV